MIREGRRALVFSAHAADFCSRAGGAIIRLLQAGGTVQVIDLTYGERCESPALWARKEKPTLEDVKAIRKDEIEAAAEVLEVSIECFDFGDSPLVLGPDRRQKMLESVRAFRPDLVLTHWLNDLMHPDHVETTQAVLWACSYCNAAGIESSSPPCARPEMVCYETTIGTAPVSKYVPDFYVDITAVFDQKAKAVAKFAAQPQLPEAYVVLGKYRAIEAQHLAGMSNCQYAEGFARIGRQGIE